jgi:hypothetical protein
MLVELCSDLQGSTSFSKPVLPADWRSCRLSLWPWALVAPELHAIDMLPASENSLLSIPQAHGGTFGTLSHTRGRMRIAGWARWGLNPEANGTITVMHIRWGYAQDATHGDSDKQLLL